MCRRFRRARSASVPGLSGGLGASVAGWEASPFGRKGDGVGGGWRVGDLTDGGGTDVTLASTCGTRNGSLLGGTLRASRRGCRRRGEQQGARRFGRAAPLGGSRTLLRLRGGCFTSVPVVEAGMEFSVSHVRSPRKVHDGEEVGVEDEVLDEAGSRSSARTPAVLGGE